jgi:acetyl esterase/lipase
MANFSEYGGLSDEFRTLWAAQPANPPPKDILEFQRNTNVGREEASANAFKTFAPSLITKDHNIPTRDGSELQARSYISRAHADTAPALPLYIHLHGGGFFFGTLDSEDAACARITLSAPVVVLNVNYRHTPDHVYPTAWNDAEDAYEWAHQHATSLQARPDKIIVGGISAGSHLTSALAQTLKREHRASSASMIGQVLMIPSLVMAECYAPQLAKMESQAISSYTENEFSPILTRTALEMFNKLQYPSIPEVNDRRANPANAAAEEVKGLPPAVFGIAGADVLRDEGLLYAQLLAQNG